MNELARPIVNLWNYIERVGGYPGQVVFLVAVVMTFVGVLTWISNRK